MKVTKFFVIVLVLSLLVTLAGAWGPQASPTGGCVAGATYDPRCDVSGALVWPG